MMKQDPVPVRMRNAFNCCIASACGMLFRIGPKPFAFPRTALYAFGRNVFALPWRSRGNALAALRHLLPGAGSILSKADGPLVRICETGFVFWLFPGAPDVVSVIIQERDKPGGCLFRHRPRFF